MSMFKRPRHNQFEYRPRYYNPDQDRFEEAHRQENAAGSAPGSRIKFDRRAGRRGQLPSSARGGARLSPRGIAIRAGSLAGVAGVGLAWNAGYLDLTFASGAMIALLVVYINQSSAYR